MTKQERVLLEKRIVDMKSDTLRLQRDVASYKLEAFSDPSIRRVLDSYVKGLEMRLASIRNLIEGSN